MRTFVIVKSVLVNAKGEVLFIQRPEHDENRPGQWDLPGGNVEPGEDFTAAIKRETLEETGIKLDAPRLVWAKSEIRAFGSGTWLVFLEKVDDPEVVLSEEHVELTWLAPEQAREVLIYHLHLEIIQYLLRNKLFDFDDPASA